MGGKENHELLVLVKALGCIYGCCVLLSVCTACLSGGLIIHAILKRRR